MKVYTNRADVGDIIRIGKMSYVVIHAAEAGESLGWHVTARQVRYCSRNNYTYEFDAPKMDFYQGGRMGGSRPHVVVIAKVKKSSLKETETQEAT
jgi:hypothetical protein